jgi:hypothetical protein
MWHPYSTSHMSTCAPRYHVCYRSSQYHHSGQLHCSQTACCWFAYVCSSPCWHAVAAPFAGVPKGHSLHLGCSTPCDILPPTDIELLRQSLHTSRSMSSSCPGLQIGTARHSTA